MTANGCVSRQQKERNTVLADERIWRGSKDCHIVLRIFGDHSDLQQLGRGIGPIHENVGLAAVTKRLEHVGDCEEIALIIDKEGVAEECVMVAAGSG